MLHAILFFSLGVTLLCCYTLYIIMNERENANTNMFVTLYQTDIKALKKPIRTQSHPSPFRRPRRPVQKRPVVEIIENVDNFYPIAPKVMNFDMRV